MIDLERIALRAAKLAMDLREISELDPADATTADAKMRLRGSYQLIAVHKFLGDLGLPWQETWPLHRLLEALKDVQLGRSPPLFEPEKPSGPFPEFDQHNRELAAHLVDAHMAAGYLLEQATKAVADLLERHQISRPDDSEARNKNPAPDTIRRWREDARKSAGFLRRAEELKGHTSWPNDELTLKAFVDKWMSTLTEEFKERGRL